MKSFLAGVALTVALGLPFHQESAVTLDAGQEAPYAGVLIPEATYRHMAKATLDLPVVEAERDQWKRGHERAIVAMEGALTNLQQCEPRRSGFEKALDSLKDLAIPAMTIYCISRTNATPD